MSRVCVTCRDDAAGAGNTQDLVDNDCERRHWGETHSAKRDMGRKECEGVTPGPSGGQIIAAVAADISASRR